jgi:hypothetical protein
MALTLMRHINELVFEVCFDATSLDKSSAQAIEQGSLSWKRTFQLVPKKIATGYQTLP